MCILSVFWQTHKLMRMNVLTFGDCYSRRDLNLLKLCLCEKSLQFQISLQRNHIRISVCASNQIQCVFKRCVPKINHQFTMKIAKRLTKFKLHYAFISLNFLLHSRFDIVFLSFPRVPFILDANYSYALTLRATHTHTNAYYVNIFQTA